MEQNDKPVLLNLGCGFDRFEGYVNVDAFDICKPDIVHDLNEFPYPWADNSVDEIKMLHILEHLDDWWKVFLECVRILKPGGYLHIHVPDESSSTALTYRDHNHVFSFVSFHGTGGSTHGSSAWAKEFEDSIPVVMETYNRVPFPEHQWMFKWPFRWLGSFCARHGRNFIWEQQFHFRKLDRGWK